MALTQVSTDGIKNGTITGSDLATNVDLVDNQRLRFGNSGDLRIFHDSTHSNISNLKNNLYIESPNYVVISSTDTAGSNQEISARFLRNGNVELYHANSLKFETSSTGATVTGTLIADGLTVGDAERIKLGNDGDLELYHTGTETFIKNSTGTLNINNDGITQIKNFADDEFIAKFTSGGSVELYHANSKKFETHSGGVSVLGNLSLTNADSYELRLGASSDLKLLHNGTDSKITNTTGNLIITQSDGIIRLDPKTNENGILIRPSTGVELYYGNEKHFETNSGGVKVNDSKYMAFGNHNDLQISHDGSNSLINVTGTGTLRIQEDGSNQWEFNGSNFKGNDSRKVILGDSSDLQLYHSGHSVVQNTNSSAAFLISSHATHIVNAALTENIAKFKEGTGGVELFHSNSKKFETNSTGCFVVGSLGVNPTSSGDVDINKEGTGVLVRLRTTGTDRGSISSNGSTVAFNTSASDRSMKKNFENWTENTLALFKNINPQRFNFLDQEDGTKKEKGFIAQDMFNSFPEAYQKNDDDKYVFNPSGMVVYLMKAIQELEAEVAALKAS